MSLARPRGLVRKLSRKGVQVVGHTALGDCLLVAAVVVYKIIGARRNRRQHYGTNLGAELYSRRVQPARR